MGRVEHHLVRLHDDAAARQRAVLLRLLDTRLPHRREARAHRLHEAHLAHAAAAREALPRADADRRATLRRLELGEKGRAVGEQRRLRLGEAAIQHTATQHTATRHTPTAAHRRRQPSIAPATVQPHLMLQRRRRCRRRERRRRQAGGG